MIQYVIREIRKPGTEDWKFYGQIAPVTPVTLTDITELIEKRSTVSSADIKAVLDALQFEVIQALKDGKSVRLGDLGSFRPTIKSEGAATAAAWNVDMVKSVNVRYTASGKIKKELAVGGQSQSVRFAKKM